MVARPGNDPPPPRASQLVIHGTTATRLLMLSSFAIHMGLHAKRAAVAPPHHRASLLPPSQPAIPPPPRPRRGGPAPGPGSGQGLPAGAEAAGLLLQRCQPRGRHQGWRRVRRQGCRGRAGRVWAGRAGERGGEAAAGRRAACVQAQQAAECGGHGATGPGRGRSARRRERRRGRQLVTGRARAAAGHALARRRGALPWRESGPCQ